jgi:formylglycine-generating enzyme required for sulfatase activity
VGIVVPCAALAKPPAVAIDRVPTLQEVVEAEGWTATPTQSGIYKPGTVLVPNARGTHDVVANSCVAAEPTVEVMSQSSIASTLKGGVKGNLGVGSAAASAGITKQLTFVDPEQRTIPLGLLQPTKECRAQLDAASSFSNLSSAILVNDVLVAIIKNTVCKRVEASGKVTALGAAEAAGFSDCVQESDGQVPVGFKSVPLGRLVSAGAGPGSAGAVGVAPVVAAAAAGLTEGSGFSGSGGFGGAGDLAKQLEAAEKLKVDLEGKLAACLQAEAAKVKSQATADWSQLAPLASKRDAVAKSAGKRYFEKFVSAYGAPRVSCKNELGEQAVLVEVSEVALARAWLAAPIDSVPVLTSGGSVGSGGYALRPVPAGSYTIGCTVGQEGECQADERPARRVTLSRAILVGETEVTQALYQRLMGNNPSHFSSCGATCPVEQVSWFDAVAFANKLSASEGLESCYVISGERVTWPKGASCLGYRLPTEAEWEVAARGGRDDKYAGGGELGAVGWYDGNSGGETHPVGQKAANGYGLYDMSGNVWEWAWDGYDSSAYAGGAAIDPVGPAPGSYRVNRGGSCYYVPGLARVADRSRDTPGNRDSNLGFRLIRTAP